MYSFKNDYSEGAHEKILEALAATNRVQTVGYGEDEYSEETREMIRREAGCPDASVWFISGGTQTNLLTISSFLRPHEAVIGAQTAHINVHETGAIEATGHKVLTAASPDGKLTPELILPILKEHKDHHMVKPAMVYISNSTEVGTIYNKEELISLSRFCRENDLIFYLDGARLGSALTSEKNDLTMKDIAALTDCFYIGGTKNGAMMGEVLVICNPLLQRDMPYLVKQKGALFAKGRMLSLQFRTLFTDNLFYELADHANQMAMKLKQGLKEEGYGFLAESWTNQQFPILPNEVIERLSENYLFEVQDKINEGETCIRLVTSWATDENAVDAFLSDLKRCERTA